MATDVRICSADIELTNWKEYQFESDIFTPADAFSFTVSNQEGEHTGEIQKFDRVQFVMDGTPQMTGYVDELGFSVDSAGGSVMEVQGRDLFGQLLDVSATPQSISGKDLGQIASQLSEEIVERWTYENEVNRKKLRVARSRFKQSLKDATEVVRRRFKTRKSVFSKVDQNSTETEKIAAIRALQGADRADIELSTAEGARVSAALKERANLAKVRRTLFPRVKVEPGDTPMDVILRHAARSGFLVWCAGDGTGVIARPDYDQEPSYKLILARPGLPASRSNNVLSASVALNGRDQFASYRVVGHGSNTLTSFGQGSRYDEAGTDAIPLSFRKLVMTGNGQNAKEAREELLRDIGKRTMMATQLTYTVRGHEQDGVLWQPDTICEVDDTLTGQCGRYYITRRRFFASRDQGQMTELTLHPPGVYLA